MKRPLLPFLLALPAAALADPSPAVDRFSLSAGGYPTGPGLRSSLATPFGTSEGGEFERGRDTMPRITGDLLFGDRQGLSFEYLRFRRDGTDNLGSPYSLGQAPRMALGSGQALPRQEFGQLAYRHWVGTGDTVLGVGAGAGYYRLGLGAGAVAGVNGFAPGFDRRYREDAFGPLFQVGLRHAFTPDLRLFADVSGVRAGGGEMQGRIYNAMAGLEWYPVHNVGLVLGYGATDIDLRRNDLGGERLRIRLYGPNAFLKARF